MLTPWISVTAIGLLVGLVGAIWGQPGLLSALRGLAGAWLGFTVGGLVGLTVDVVAQTGAALVVAGHASAVLVAVTAVSLAGRRQAQPVPHQA